jgi:Zn-dependent M28 family amino/carboxypeptidase
VKYVADQLKRMGYKPVVQDFDFNFFEQTGPSLLEKTAPAPPKTYTEAPEDGSSGDYAVLSYSGAGDVTGAVSAVDTGSPDSGCEAADFAGFTAGNIALIKRGTCFFEDKARNAVAAGAIGVLIYNDGASPDREGPVLGNLNVPFEIPIVGPSFAVGQELLALVGQGLTLHLKTDTLNEVRAAKNVIAETSAGRDDNVVVVGAHLDSVPAGPGINDNGSGVAALLSMAKQLQAPKGEKPAYPSKYIKNKVRFGFWGAEEQGLFGSQAYVDSLTPEQLAKLGLNLNFDMLASPNFVRFVYDGDDSLGAGTAPPDGSGAIEYAFTKYFADRGLETEETPFDGRSDYNAFQLAGIPAGGLFSGAEDPKTPEEAAIYGGTAGEAYDHCYHSACDTYDNVNLTGYDQLLDGAAFAVEKYAYSTLPVNGIELAPNAKVKARPATFKGPRAVR